MNNRWFFNYERPFEMEFVQLNTDVAPAGYHGPYKNKKEAIRVAICDYQFLVNRLREAEQKETKGERP